MRRTLLLTVVLAALMMSHSLGCEPAQYLDLDREEFVPDRVSKRRPETDRHPPILHSDDYHEPVGLPYPVNTAGGEDSPFILPDGNTLYFFFTPDVRLSPTEELKLGVTGVYVTGRVGSGWSPPERVWLERPGKPSLEGAVCVQGGEMWFASARQGRTGVNMFTAELVDGQWSKWQYVGDRLMKELQIGEVHIHADDLYFHSERPGGMGGLDIWVTTRHGALWSDPVNITAVNTDASEGFPCISPDGSELWFTRTYLGTPGVFRSVLLDGEWGEPELVISQFAGEPTVDQFGNVYFVHHFFEDGEMIEADIYVAYKKP